MGLSPRVRGSLGRWHDTDDELRSIPASAGQPAFHIATHAIPSVYPRECGAALFHVDAQLAKLGLSPRVRGSLTFDPCELTRLRSIPASAGQPKENGIGAGALPVYPRECGAAIAECWWGMAEAGLSPRVRGSRIMATNRIPKERSIPASAGQPHGIMSGSDTVWVYPRECGAATGSGVEADLYIGLSPRVRGSRRVRESRRQSRRSIPASAGQPH